MKQLDLSSSSLRIEEEDESDDDDDDDEQQEEEQPPQPVEQESSGNDENSPARANVEAAATLGSIEVKDGPAEHKMEELRAFLEKELPEIQKNVALRARTLWWKQKENDDKLEDARSKLTEVRRLIEAIEPGMPSMAGAGETAAPTV